MNFTQASRTLQQQQHQQQQLLQQQQQQQPPQPQQEQPYRYSAPQTSSFTSGGNHRWDYSRNHSCNNEIDRNRINNNDFNNRPSNGYNNRFDDGRNGFNNNYHQQQDRYDAHGQQVRITAEVCTMMNSRGQNTYDGGFVHERTTPGGRGGGGGRVLIGQQQDDPSLSSSSSRMMYNRDNDYHYDGGGRGGGFGGNRMDYDDRYMVSNNSNSSQNFPSGRNRYNNCDNGRGSFSNGLSYHRHHQQDHCDYEYDCQQPQQHPYPDNPGQFNGYNRNMNSARSGMHQGYGGSGGGNCRRVEVVLDTKELVGTDTARTRPSSIGTFDCDDGWPNDSSCSDTDEMHHKSMSDDSTDNDDDCHDDSYDNYDCSMNSKLPPRTRSNENFYNNNNKWNEKDVAGMKHEDDYKYKTPMQDQRKTIEVSPGVHVPVRGADETWQAVLGDFYVPVQCIGCESTIFSIQDANYVLCPICRVIGPVSFDGEQQQNQSAAEGGVGLGFTMEDLAGWQEKIAYERNVTAKLNRYH